ncbi:MAG: WYL domain-containing protein, partial [Actinobacteria bacterium]|nr:WYL domain-containing protein [Actinomycetota bacterium]
RRRVTFGYRGRPRTVDPHRLSFRNGHWYLAGTDRDAEEARSYRLDRMEGSVQVGEPGSAPDVPAPADGAAAQAAAGPWAQGTDDPVMAQLLIDADQAGWAVRHVGADAVAERREDGSVVLDVRVTNRDAFRSFVLGFLDHAELLGPPELREDLVSWLEALCPA